jgi:hypothetical protein
MNKSFNTIRASMDGLSADSTHADIAAALGKINAASTTGGKKIERNMSKEDKKPVLVKNKNKKVRSAPQRKQGRIDKNDFHKGKGGQGGGKSGGKGGGKGKRGAARGHAAGPRRDTR